MTITQKGQVTIPLALRERACPRPGTEVELVPHFPAITVLTP
jgi:bifunctional DNA-binding transcriptional regulator/antitoxin component of YhaV-PrlF toxin-antitoxin module